jgi:hypothetical protein
MRERKREGRVWYCRGNGKAECGTVEETGRQCGTVEETGRQSVVL